MGDKSSQMHLGYPWQLAVQDPCNLADIKDDKGLYSLLFLMPT